MVRKNSHSRGAIRHTCLADQPLGRSKQIAAFARPHLSRHGPAGGVPQELGDPQACERPETSSGDRQTRNVSVEVSDCYRRPNAKKPQAIYLGLRSGAKENRTPDLFHAMNRSRVHRRPPRFRQWIIYHDFCRIDVHRRPLTFVWRYSLRYSLCAKMLGMAAHRGNGEGSVFQEGARSGRTDGRWIAQVVVDGRYRRRVAPTEAKAKRLLRDMQAKIAAGESPGDGNITVAQLLEKWKNNALPARELSIQTITVYQWCIDVLTETIGSHRADRLTADHVEKAFKKLAEHGRKGSRRPMSRTSLIKLRSVLGKALDYGYRRKLVSHNVARFIELPVVARRPEPGRSLTVEQAKRLLDATADDRLHALWRLMLMTGLRPGEATGLAWNDVDLDNSIIHVRRSLKLENGKLHVTETLKTSRSRRSLRADASVIEALRRHKKQQAEEHARSGPDVVECRQPRVHDISRQPDRPQQRPPSSARATQGAGLGRWHPHELRHSTASILSAAGVPTRTDRRRPRNITAPA